MMAVMLIMLLMMAVMSISGRCIIARRLPRNADVSIRARHVCRAMHFGPRVPLRVMVFQSAPGTCAGRCYDFNEITAI